ncbi:hypothetical protein Efla_004125 [Eimeria flavescens]
MGLCRRNKAKVLPRQSQTAGVDAVAPPPVDADEPRYEPVELKPRPATGEDVTATPRSSDDRNLGSSLECPARETVVDSAVKRNLLGPTALHAHDPPARNDSATTSCAGMTDSDYMSRRSTLQAELQSLQRAASMQAMKERKQPQEQLQTQPPVQESQLAITEPSQQQEEESTLAVPAPQAAPAPRAETRKQETADSNSSPRPQQQFKRSQEPNLALEDKEKPLAIADHPAPQDSPAPQKEAGKRADAAAGEEEREKEKKKKEEKEEEGGAQADGLATKVSEAFSTVKQSLSRGYQSLRSVNVAESFRQAPTDVLPELQEAEHCVCGVLNDLTEIGERAVPCLSGDHADEYTEAVAFPAPQIMMVVNTPAGPYLRQIPEGLVEEAISMGFISEEEVMRQRQEWQDTYGPIPIGYTPAISFAEQQAQA